MKKVSGRGDIPQAKFISHGVSVVCGNVLEACVEWPKPTCIIADGPYGLGKFPGDPQSTDELARWYEPHIIIWSGKAADNATLWFWSSEIGWAKIHGLLELYGWQYEECHVWDKGIAHIAGNCNGKTIRGTPVVTEIAVRYTRRHLLPDAEGKLLPLKAWIRKEWERSGLPLAKANEACGVVNAATRKYLTTGYLWYFPPPEAIVRMSNYCLRYGRKTERPYFSLDGVSPVTEEAWASLRAKWNHIHGITNVWQEPAVRGRERLSGKKGYLHATQKPLALMERQILLSTDPGDVVWEPFGGLCTATVAALRHGRKTFAAEINQFFFEAAILRVQSEITALHGNWLSPV